MMHKKVTPLTQTTDYDPGPALPGSPIPSRARFSEQETTNCLSKKQQQLLQGSDTLWAKARRIFVFSVLFQGF